MKSTCTWKSVTFGDTTLKRVTGGGFRKGGTLLRFKSDPDMYSTITANVTCEPNATFTTADVGTVMGIAPGTMNELAATLTDDGGEIKFTMINAVFENADTTAQHAKFGTGTWQAFSEDGETNPLSFALVRSRPEHPDALMMPETRKTGTRMVDRVASIADVAEPLLGVDRARGERAYIRLQGNGKLFISKSIFDTIKFPRGHKWDGQARYLWERKPDGIEFGYLFKEAS